MTSNRPETSSAFDRPTTIAISVALALALLGAMWLIGQAFAGPAATAGPTATPEPWPTVPATLTPTVAAPTATLVVPPTPTMIPTPTPIPITIEDRQRIATLGTFAITASTVHTETQATWGGPLPFFGTDSITIYYVARVTLGVNFDQVIYTPQGERVTVRVPALRILSVEYDSQRSQIINRQVAWGKTEIDKVLLQAWGKADAGIRANVAEDEELLSLARLHTELRIKDQLRELGFQQIDVIFAQE